MATSEGQSGKVSQPRGVANCVLCMEYDVQSMVFGQCEMSQMVKSGQPSEPRQEIMDI